MKTRRQHVITKIINEKKVSTLKELQQKLLKRGIKADTATLSRDIRELGIVRGTGSNGAHAYTFMANAPLVKTAASQSITSKFVRGFTSTGNMVIIKTITGTASTVGDYIDGLNWKAICGTIAGENTIFVAVSQDYNSKKVQNKLEKELVS